MTEKTAVPVSVLDLSPIPQGAKPRDAFHASLDLAQHAEKWGYQRYWLAEHHNMTGIGSAATSVLLGYLAAGTQSIRLGSGGVMLPNHAPLVIAEQFGTLESLYPGRIDLGLGRAPGTDQRTMMALRRHLSGEVDNFPRDVQELQHYFCDAQPGQPVQAVPGQGLHVPLWLLGSSLYSAQLAAQLGLPFAFASHFAPEMLFQALKLYRDNFKASEQCINLRRGSPGPLPAPLDNIHALWTAGEQYGVDQALRMSIIGNENTVRHGLQTLLNETGADEIMVNGQIFDHQARLHSFEIVAGVKDTLAKG